MTTWSGGAQAYLDAGGVPTFFVAVSVQAKRLDDGSPVVLNFWNGVDDEDFAVGGVVKSFQAVGGALTVDAVQNEVGTTIRNSQITIDGLSPEGETLYKSTEVEKAPFESYSLMMNAGGVYLGSKRLMKGVIDTNDLGIGDEGSVLSVDVTRQMLSGTRVIQAKKSHASYQRRSGDEAMQYASLKEVESDSWG